MNDRNYKSFSWYVRILHFSISIYIARIIAFCKLMMLIYKDVSLFEFQVTNYVMQSKSAVSKTDFTYFDESCFVFTEDRGNQGSLSVADFRALFVSLLKSCVSSRRECVYINQGLFLLLQ